MKKIIALILVAVMLAALASCAKDPNNESTSSSSSTSATTESTSTTTESTKNEQTTETTTTSDPVTPPEKKELADIISATYEKHPISIGVSTDKLDLEHIDADTIQYISAVKSLDKVSEISISGPMMAPPAYQMVVVRVKDASDAESVAKEMLENANPAKWVCVQAECVRIGVCGDTIMMVMYSVDDATALINAFGEVCGGLTSAILEK